MALTDREIRELGWNYVPNQEYLLNLFEPPTTTDDDDETTPGSGTGSGGGGGNNNTPEAWQDDYNPITNPDPNSTRMPNQYIDYLDKNRRTRKNNPLEKGIGFLKNTFMGQGLGAAYGILQDIMPMNKTAIMNNEMLGQGFAVDNIGRIVRVDQGDPDTAGNIMAGRNISRMSEKTFQDRLDNLNMSEEGEKKRRAAIEAAREAWRRAKIKTGNVYHDKYKDREDYRMLDTKYEDWEKEHDAGYNKSDEQKLAMTGSEDEWGDLSDPNNPLGPEPDPNNYGFDNSENFIGEGPGPEPSNESSTDWTSDNYDASDLEYVAKGGRVGLNLGGLARPFFYGGLARLL